MAVDSVPLAVMQKYRILDAKTGEEKHGHYFVLKIDASSDIEKIAVANALLAYCKTHRDIGDPLWAEKVRRSLEDSLD